MKNHAPWAALALAVGLWVAPAAADDAGDAGAVDAGAVDASSANTITDAGSEDANPGPPAEEATPRR
jgi:hypothetical protein